MRICDEAPLTIVVVTRGEAWITTETSTVCLPTGSAALVRGPGHYIVSSAPGTPPDIVIHPGQRCETLDGASLAMTLRLGVRTWGDALDAPTALITGTYENHSTIGSDLASLASRVGTSRANLARRFNLLVGQPPIAYLTHWRLSLAADLMCEPQASVTSVATTVGYASPYAFSTAFKRRYGLSPFQHRAIAVTSA